MKVNIKRLRPLFLFAVILINHINLTAQMLDISSPMYYNYFKEIDKYQMFTLKGNLS